MAIKNLQFLVTVSVNVPDGWECPAFGTEAVENEIGGALYANNDTLAASLDASAMEATVVFETVTD